VFTSVSQLFVDSLHVQALLNDA